MIPSPLQLPLLLYLLFSVGKGTKEMNSEVSKGSANGGIQFFNQWD